MEWIAASVCVVAAVVAWISRARWASAMEQAYQTRIDAMQASADLAKAETRAKVAEMESRRRGYELRIRALEERIKQLRRFDERALSERVDSFRSSCRRLQDAHLELQSAQLGMQGQYHQLEQQLATCLSTHREVLPADVAAELDVAFEDADAHIVSDVDISSEADMSSGVETAQDDLQEQFPADAAVAFHEAEPEHDAAAQVELGADVHADLTDEQPTSARLTPPENAALPLPSGQESKDPNTTISVFTEEGPVQINPQLPRLAPTSDSDE